MVFSPIALHKAEALSLSSLCGSSVLGSIQMFFMGIFVVVFDLILLEYSLFLGRYSLPPGSGGLALAIFKIFSGTGIPTKI